MADADREEQEMLLMLPDIIREETRFMATLFGYRQATNLHFVVGAREILRNFEMLESYCDAPTESRLDYERCTVDLSIQEALQFPRRIAARTPMDITNCRQFTNQDLKLMWCRLVSHYFEWLAGVPEIKSLSDIDKMRLVTRQLCKVICWTVAWRSRSLVQGLTFGCGLVYSPQKDCDSTIRDYVSNLATVIQELPVTKIRELQLTRHEYILVKLAILFSNNDGIALSPAGREVCSSALNKYTAALAEEVAGSRALPSRRTAEMLEVLRQMETVSEVDDQHLKSLTMSNFDNLQGRLTTEIHVHARF